MEKDVSACLFLRRVASYVVKIFIRCQVEVVFGVRLEITDAETIFMNISV